MKKYYPLFAFVFLTSTVTLAQKSEKIKGSKIVTTETKEIGEFSAIEINDDCVVFLDLGEKTEVKIEADNNLHEIVTIDLNDSTLKISTKKNISNYKKLIIRITYSKKLKMITVRDEAILNAIQEMQLDEIAFKTFDKAQLNLNVNCKTFSLQADNNAKTELNLKAEKTNIQLSKSASLKALISSDELQCDLYQKTKATIEGDANHANIRLDNNSEFTAGNLVIKKAELLSEAYAESSINVAEILSIDVSGNTNTQLYGDPKIELKRFADNAVLSKKPTK